LDISAGYPKPGFIRNHCGKGQTTDYCFLRALGNDFVPDGKSLLLDYYSDYFLLVIVQSEALPAPALHLRTRSTSQMLSRKRPRSPSLTIPNNIPNSNASDKLSLSNSPKEPQEKRRVLEFSSQKKAGLTSDPDNIRMLWCNEEMPDDFGPSEDEWDDEVKNLVQVVNQLYHKDQLAKKHRGDIDSAARPKKGLPSSSSTRKGSGSRDSKNSIGGSSSDSDVERQNGGKEKHGSSWVRENSNQNLKDPPPGSNRIHAAAAVGKNDQDLVQASEYVCHSWDSLQLGTILGSAAYNEFLRGQLYVGVQDLYSSDQEVPQLTAEQLLEVVQSLRPATVLPPPDSVLHWHHHQPQHEEEERSTPVLFDDTTIVARRQGQVGHIGNDEEEDNDWEVEAINDDVAPPRSKGGGTGAHETHERTHQDDFPEMEALVTDLTQLYETLCWQDADDWSSYRRHANRNLSARACISELQSLEREAQALKQKESQVLEAGRELGLYVGPKIATDVASLLGCGRLPHHDPYI
jgi:hypothetical protein